VIIPNNTHSENFTGTEPWVAWLRDDGYGLGLYYHSPDGLHSSWTMSRELSPPPGTNTNTMQNWYVLNLQPGQTVQSRHFVIYGTLPIIRATVYEMEGRSWFQDVDPLQDEFRFINTLFRNGVTSGCAGGPPRFCPTNNNQRAEMAVFLLSSKNPPHYLPPAAQGNMFPDVPASHWAARWIEEAVRQGIMSGCDATQVCPPQCTASQFCPDAPVKRGPMARFLLKAKLGPAYNPPAATGIFHDVPVSNPNAAWIEDLYHREITGGCGGGNYCPNDDNTRGQMSVFLTATFGLN
jgi:hypothetical protein